MNLPLNLFIYQRSRGYYHLFMVRLEKPKDDWSFYDNKNKDETGLNLLMSCGITKI